MSKSEIHGHKVDAFNLRNVIIARTGYRGDPPVEGTRYEISVLVYEDVPRVTSFDFQSGTAKEVGVNGITTEAMLAIALDRLECFQRGAYKCRENALAITKIEEALLWLGHRSNDRERRGVEGTKEL